MRLTPKQFATLCHVLFENYNEDRFSYLVRTRLGIKWDKVIRKDKSFEAKIPLLIEMLEESETTSDLIQVVLTARPDLQDSLAEILTSLHAEATTVPQQADKVKMGVDKVAQGLSKREVRTLVKQLEGALTKLEQDIQLLRSYKGFHDDLHFVQLELRRFANAVRDLLSASMAATDLKESVDVLMSHALHAQSSINDLPLRPTSVRKVEEAWIVRLRQAAQNGATARTQKDPALGREAAQEIRTIIRQQPPRIDLILRMTAEALELALLTDLFSKVASVSKLPADVLKSVREGHPAAERILRQVQALVNQHAQWQQIDLSLWNADDALPRSSASDPSDFDASWGGLKRKIMALIDSDPASQWATTLMHACNQVDACRKLDDWSELRHNFDDFRHEAVNQFFAVDSTLKLLAGEIGGIGSSVKSLLREL